MLAYRTPGVYFEQIDQRSRAIDILRTDIAGFVGIAARGPLHEPVKVESWVQFTSTFGGHIPQGYLAYAVEGFFANGGQTCWVVRVADPATARRADVLLTGDRTQIPVHILANDVGRMEVAIKRTGDGRFMLALRLADGSQETWRNLSLDKEDSRYVRRVLNHPQQGSQLVQALTDSPPPGVQSLEIANSQTIFAGADGLAGLELMHISGIGAPADRELGLVTLEKIDEVSMIAIPDIMPKPIVEVTYRMPLIRCDVLDAEPAPEPPPDTQPEFPPAFSSVQILSLQNELIAHCQKLKDRVAILDAPQIKEPEQRLLTPEDATGWRNQFDTTYAALYYPWLLVPDPLRLEGLLRPLPPSSHIAGIYARVSTQVGVHKPPANEALEAVKDVQIVVGDIDHGDLNTGGVNAIRIYNGRGVRSAGARTLSRDSEWRYVNVRRLLLMIEESIDERLQWTVFEPNNPALWRDVERVVRNFLTDLWRRGMLDGATEDEAFQVRCDAETNPPQETDRCRMICTIQVQPPWPAEFVVVRIGITEGSTEIIEG